MQPVAFLREAWKKWQKRSGKRKAPAATLDYIPSPRRSKTASRRHASSISGLSKPNHMFFGDCTKSGPHKWVSIKRRGRSSTINERPSSFCHSPRRDSHPAYPLTCFTTPARSQYRDQDDHSSDFHPHLGRNSCNPSSHLRSLRLLPPIEVNHSRENVYNITGLKSDQSSLTSHSSPNIPCLIIAEKTNPGVVPSHTTRIAPRTTRLPIAPPAKSDPCGTRHPKTKLSAPPKVYDGQTLVSLPGVSIGTTQSGDAHDFPLSLFPQPPLLVREKVPKPLVLRPARPSSTRSLLPYSSPTSLRPGSMRSFSQTSFSSKTTKGFGRPLTSVSPPPTSPPNSPLPSPPVDKRMDSSLSSSYPGVKAPGAVKHRPRTTGSIVDRPDTSVGSTSAQLYRSRFRDNRKSQPPVPCTGNIPTSGCQ